jgi:hypothetical protein
MPSLRVGKLHQVPSIMGIFHRKHRESATPLEDAAEDEASSPHHVFRGTPDLAGSGSSAMLNDAAQMVDSGDGNAVSRKRHRAEANLEDDSAETQLINEERRQEEY